MKRLQQACRPQCLKTPLLWALLVACGLVWGCSDGGSSDAPPADDPPSEESPQEPDDNDQNPENEKDKDKEDDDGGDSSPSSDIGDNDPGTLVAIGDSVTAGNTLSGPSYPDRLSGILGKRVVNRGSPGAYSSGAGGHAASAMSYKPSYLLIMYGTNDVFAEVSSDAVAANVRAAVQQAKANRTIPVVGTIPPNLKSDFQNGLVASINGRLKAMASSEGAKVARVNSEFGSGAGLIQEDGYHPNETGAQVIAFAFADAIR